MNIGQFLNEDNGAQDTEYQGDLVVDIIAANEAAMDLQEVTAIGSQLSNAYDTLAAAASDRAASIVSGNESAGDASLDARMEATVTAVASTLGLSGQIVAGNESAEEKGQGLMSKIWKGIVNAVDALWQKIVNLISTVSKMVVGIFSKNESAGIKMDSMVGKITAKSGDKITDEKVVANIAESLKVLALMDKPGVTVENIIEFFNIQKYIVAAAAKGDLEENLLNSVDVFKKAIVDAVDGKDTKALGEEVTTIIDKTIALVIKLDKFPNIKSKDVVKKAITVLAKKHAIDEKEVGVYIYAVTSKSVKVGLFVSAKGIFDHVVVTVTASAKEVKDLEKTVTKLSAEDVTKISKAYNEDVGTFKKEVADITKRSKSVSKAVTGVMADVQKTITTGKELDKDSAKEVKKLSDDVTKTVKNVLPVLYSGSIETIKDFTTSKIVEVVKASLPEKEEKK